MPFIYISIGSNIDKKKHIISALSTLEQYFGHLTLSHIYETKSVGFEGDDFYNLVAGFESDQPIEQIAATLSSIENEHGRNRNQPKFSSRTLDLDLLLYDDLILKNDHMKIPRDEILKYAFVLAPLAEIAGNSIHPEKQVSYQQLWNNFGPDQTIKIIHEAD